MGNFELLSFENIIQGLRETIKELRRTEDNASQKVILLAEKLKEKHFRLLGKKSLPHHEPANLKKAEKPETPSISPWTYLVLLKKDGALALRVNYPGSDKEHLVLLSETD